MIKLVTRGQYKICKDILSGLPDWFAIPSANESYAHQAEESPFFVYYKKAAPVGICMLKIHTPSHIEVALIAVRPDCHRQGIGKKLFQEALSNLRESVPHVKYITVKTLSPEKRDPHYLKTYEFYKDLGFENFEELPELWDKNNPCLIMIKET